MTDETIKRHPDGSIDISYYQDRARAARSHAAYGVLRRAWHQLLAAWARADAAIETNATATHGAHPHVGPG